MELKVPGNSRLRVQLIRELIRLRKSCRVKTFSFGLLNCRVITSKQSSKTKRCSLSLKRLIEVLYNGMNAFLVASICLCVAKEVSVVGSVNGGFSMGLQFLAESD